MCPKAKDIKFWKYSQLEPGLLEIIAVFVVVIVVVVVVFFSLSLSFFTVVSTLSSASFSSDQCLALKLKGEKIHCGAFVRLTEGKRNVNITFKVFCEIISESLAEWI